MVTVTKMRLAFEASVRRANRGPMKVQIVKSLKNKNGLKFGRKRS